MKKTNKVSKMMGIEFNAVAPKTINYNTALDSYRKVLINLNNTFIQMKNNKNADPEEVKAVGELMTAVADCTSLKTILNAIYKWSYLHLNYVKDVFGTYWAIDEKSPYDLKKTVEWNNMSKLEKKFEYIVTSVDEPWYCLANTQMNDKEIVEWLKYAIKNNEEHGGSLLYRSDFIFKNQKLSEQLVNENKELFVEVFKSCNLLRGLVYGNKEFEKMFRGKEVTDFTPAFDKWFKEYKLAGNYKDSEEHRSKFAKNCNYDKYNKPKYLWGKKVKKLQREWELEARYS